MNGTSRHRSQVLALAAMYQALAQVRQIATTGRWEADSLETCLRGLLVAYEDDVAAVYGGVTSLESGLRVLHLQLGQPGDMQLTRYAVMVMHLERKLMKRRDMLARLARGIEESRQQADYFSISHENVVHHLADLYQQTVSTLTPPIMVQGKREWLGDSDRAARIRALLLSSIRAATFWRQAGGGRLRLIFARQRMQRLAATMLEELTRS